MSNKRKRKPSNPFRYWLDEFLFARHFAYELDSSLYEVETQIMTLAHEPRFTLLWGHVRTSYTIVDETDKGFVFNLRRKHGKKPPWVMAHTHGTVMIDSGTGNLRIQGTIKIGVLYYLLMLSILPVGMIFLRLPIYDDFMKLFGIVQWSLFVIAGMWSMYAARNHLANVLEQTFNEKQKRDVSRLETSDDSPHETDYQHEYEQQGVIHD